MIYFIKAWQYSDLNIYALIPAVLTTARRLSTMNGLNMEEKNRKRIKNMLLLNVNFLSRDFLYLFKYGLVSGVILALKICYSLKFLKFRPFTLFLFYKHYKHTSCRHYLMFVEFQGKSIFEQKRLFAKYSTKWEERQMHRHKESVGIYHVSVQTKPPSFFWNLQHPKAC